MNLPEARCLGERADVTFTWQRLATAPTSQFVDLSLVNNGFTEGTYISLEVSKDAEALRWEGLLAGLPHFWRVTAQANDGWVVSKTGSFVPCGKQALLGVSHVCTGDGRATASFHWAPSTPPRGPVWLDLSAHTGDFSPGTFIAGGPLSPLSSRHDWPGVLVNVTHYWRLNSTNQDGQWSPAPTQSFRLAC